MTDFDPAVATRLVEERRRCIATIPPDEWVAMTCPNDLDPDTFAFGYGQLRTAPLPDGGGFSLLLECPKHDDQDAVLEFCASSRTAWPEALDMLESAVREIERLQKLCVKAVLVFEHEAAEAESEDRHDDAKYFSDLSLSFRKRGAQETTQCRE